MNCAFTHHITYKYLLHHPNNKQHSSSTEPQSTPILGNPKNRWKLIGRGICVATSQLCMYMAFRLLPLGDAITIQQLNGPMAAVAAWAILGESLTKNRVWGLATGVLGVMMVAQPPFLFGGGSNELGGVVLALTAAV